MFLTVYMTLYVRRAPHDTFFQKSCLIALNNISGMNNKIFVFEHSNFTKRCSFFPSKLGCFSFSSQLGRRKGTHFAKIEMLNITKLSIIYCVWQFIIQLQAVLIKFEITIFNIYYENDEIIKKGVPQSAKISKLEWISWKFPSQLEFGGEQLFWGTAREVLFFISFKKWPYNCISSEHCWNLNTKTFPLNNWMKHQLIFGILKYLINQVFFLNMTLKWNT